MQKRHKLSVENNSNDKISTLFTPKNVGVPKRKKKKIGGKARQKQIELALEMEYVQKLSKINPKDLAVIHRPDVYPKDRKKDRRFNQGVTIAKDELRLLSFLVEMLKPRYRNKIFLSDEFNRFLKKYLDISDETSIELTQDEKNQSLIIAIQMLGNSLALIKKNMPPEFQNSLNNLGLPFANFIDAISLYAQDKDKSVPKISISKLFKLK